MPPATILFLAANPLSTTPLALDEEVRAIEGMIRAASHRDAFRLVSRWATRVDDLQQQLLEQRPVVVHFSGHGNASGGLLLHNNEGTRQAVTPAAVAGLFRVLRDNVRVVFFNACHSLSQAEAVSQEIDCVIGMSEAIGDHAARVLAASFYRALGFGRSVGEAFELGRSALLLEGIPEEQTPRLLTRPGINANTVHVLQAPTDPNVPRSTPVGKPRLALLAAPDDAPWLKKLQIHLRPIARKAAFEVWDSSMVPAGARWRDAVAEGFARASVVVVLVSPSLLADDEFAESRLPELVARADASSVQLLSLIVSACAFRDTELDAYNPLNPPDEPLDALSPSEQGKRLLAAALQIAAAANAGT